jgi:hypothetical protein
MSGDRILLNGVNGATGRYLTELQLKEAAALARRQPPTDPKTVSWLRRIWDLLKRPFLVAPVGVNLDRPVQAGWGVVFAADTPPTVRDALEPLLAHRARRVPPDRCKVGDRALVYRPGTHWRAWLNDHGVDPGGIRVTRVPYYLMLVGDPTAIPFEFQYGLDMEYAVGRVAFEHPEQYRQYAESVVAYETADGIPNAREIVYWATRHPNDPSTQMSADWLVDPLVLGTMAEGPEETKVATELAGSARPFLRCKATKDTLRTVLHCADSAPPAMLFAAAHGIDWPLDDPCHGPAQGALLCQGFPLGDYQAGRMQPEDYLAAADVTDDARVFGLVAFLFGCFSAGTPEFDTFDRRPERRRLAQRPFISRLPQRLLSHPHGGALAVIGHIDQASGYSIRPLKMVNGSYQPVDNVGPQLTPYRNLLHRILSGEPVGHATKDLNEKYGYLVKALQDKLDATQPGPPPTDADVGLAWLERNDFQNYVLLGDPAVQLRVNLLRS